MHISFISINILLHFSHLINNFYNVQSTSVDASMETEAENANHSLNFFNKLKATWTVCNEGYFSVLSAYLSDENLGHFYKNKNFENEDLKDVIINVHALVEQKHNLKRRKFLIFFGSNRQNSFSEIADKSSVTFDTGKNMNFCFFKSGSEEEKSIEIFSKKLCIIICSKQISDKFHKAFWESEAVSFHPKKSLVLYIAERSEEHSETNEKKEIVETPKKFDYEDNWGEQSFTKKYGRIFVFNFSTGFLYKLAVSYSNASYSEACWLEDTEAVLMTKYKINPYRLGTKYCNNRESCVYLVILKTDFNEKRTKVEEIAVDKMEGELDCEYLKISDENDFSAWSPIAVKFDASTSSNLSIINDIYINSKNKIQDIDSCLDKNEETDKYRSLKKLFLVLYMSLEKNTASCLAHVSAVKIKSVLIQMIEESQEKIEENNIKKIPKFVILKRQTILDNNVNKLHIDFHGIYSFKLDPFFSECKEWLFVNTFFGPVSGISAIGLKHPKETVGRLFLTNVNELVIEKETEEYKETQVFKNKLYNKNNSLMLLDVKKNVFLIQVSSPFFSKLLVAKIVNIHANFEVFELNCIFIQNCSELTLQYFPNFKCSTENEENEIQNNSISCFYKLKEALKNINFDLIEKRHVYIYKDDYKQVKFSKKENEENEQTEEKRKLLVFLHGGPHSVFSVSFNSEYTFYYLCGYDILGVNYIGSAGFCNDEVLSLLGKAGDVDVKDAYHIISNFLKNNNKKYDTNKVCVTGGSHGGFLTCHLIGQYPLLFGSAAVRNPVTNFPAMISATDIPDWCYAEAVHEKFTYDKIYNEESLLEMHKKSPIFYIKNVITPLLLAVGEIDKRVPPSQSIQFYKILKAQKKDCKLKYYPENDHRIMSLECSQNFIINSVLWFEKYTNREKAGD